MELSTAKDSKRWRAYYAYQQLVAKSIDTTTAVFAKSSKKIQLTQSQSALLEIDPDEDAIDLTDFILLPLDDSLDPCAPVLITGHSTMRIDVKAAPDNDYRFPLYSPPGKGYNTLTRQQIDEQGRLKGLGLELAYAKSLLDVYIMQVQGAGVLNYVDSDQQIAVKVATHNVYAYRSIGRYFIEQQKIPKNELNLTTIRDYINSHPSELKPALFSNPRYSYFRKIDALTTANGTEPLALATATVDTTRVPFGSLLLVEMPNINPAATVDQDTPQEHSILVVANDIGTAFKGHNRVGLYFGHDEQRAGALNHQARVWVLAKTPK